MSRATSARLKATRLPPLRLQDGHRLGQDDRDGDARGLEHPQQGQRPQRRPLLRRGAGRLPERHDPQPAGRARPGTGGEPLPHARPRAPAPDADLTQGRCSSPTGTSSSRRGSRPAASARRSSKAGVPVRVRKKPSPSAPKTTTARGRRYLTRKSFDRQVAAGLLTVIEEERDNRGNLKKVVRRMRCATSRATRALVNRVLGREVGGKQNILVLNDEAHHAYRIRKAEPDEDEEELLRRGRGERGVLQGGDGLGRRARPHPQAARHQLLRRSLGDALLPRPRRAGHEPDLSLGGQRLRADRRDRVGAGEDSAARRARHHRRGDSRLLQHLALDPAEADPGRARRAEGQSRSRRRS